MLNRLTLFVVFGTITLGLSACGESPAPASEADASKAEAPKAAAVEGPYYELTKDTVTNNLDWNSRNVMVMGIKLGDKTNDVAEKSLGAQMGKTNVLADEYQTYYQKNGIALFTFKLTNKIKRIEVLLGFAEKISSRQRGFEADARHLRHGGIHGRETGHYGNRIRLRCAGNPIHQVQDRKYGSALLGSGKEVVSVMQLPLLARRGGCAIRKKSRSNFRGADGVVGQEAA
jgi:hypothetical protein